MQSYTPVKFLAACFLFSLIIVDVHAQVLQKSAQKIRSYKNISYTDIVRVRFHFQDEFSADTIKSQLFPVANEPAGGYYAVKNNTNSYAYDGNKLVNLNFTDSTYRVEKESEGGQFTRTLLYWAKNMDKFVKLPLTKFRVLPDTLINKVPYAYLSITESDTIVANVRQFNITRFVIDKKSYLPVNITRHMKGNANDGSLFELIEMHDFSNYKFNQRNFPDLSAALIPAHFHEPVKGVPAVFLPTGTIAPPIKAVDLEGNQLDLEKLKGKIVLINFSLIGCPHCVGAAQMLNRLHEQYKDKDVVILNIYPVDQKEAISKFDKKENVQTQSYTSDRTVQKIYPYDGYPSFYLLDKNGVVAQSYNGFYKALEADLIKTIDTILK